MAQTPLQLENVNKVLTTIKKRNDCGLSLIVNVVFWGFPKPKKPNINYIYPVNSQTAELISECVNLKKLVIGKGPDVISLPIEDLQRLANCRNLELVDIDHTTLSNKAFTSNNRLTEKSLLSSLLKLKCFRLRGIDGSEGDPILPCLKINTELKRLGIWLGKGAISDSELLFLENFKNITELILSTCTSSGNAKSFEILKHLPLIHLGLFYSENSKLTNENFDCILEIRTLSSLHIGGWNLNADTLSNLKNATKLTNFCISRVLLSKQGMQHISECKTITILRIFMVSSLIDGDFAPLLELNLLQLSLDNIGSITDAALAILSNHTTLTGITLNGISKITITSIRFLANMKNITMLFIKNCGLIGKVDIDGLISTTSIDNFKGEKPKLTIKFVENRPGPPPAI
jgi:hypothetical protein